jgi:hypothetical protein
MITIRNVDNRSALRVPKRELASPEQLEARPAVSGKDPKTLGLGRGWQRI